MTRSEFGFEVLVRSCIAPSYHALKLLIRPRIKINRLDPADMCSHSTVNTGTSDADEDAKIPAGPSRMLVFLAVCAALVAFELDQLLQRLLVLCRLVRANDGSSGHLGWIRCRSEDQWIVPRVAALSRSRSQDSDYRSSWLL